MPRPLGSPRSPRYDSSLALSALSAADPADSAASFSAPAPSNSASPAPQSPFEALVESIIYQQLHGKAAATIHRRLLESFYPVTAASGPAQHFAAQHLLDCPNEQLRAAGLSHNKSLALRDLAAKTLDGTVPTLPQIRRMSDQAIIDHLTQVRGIGPWSGEMLLILRLGRPDVRPVSDYGVRKGFAPHLRQTKTHRQSDPSLDLP